MARPKLLPINGKMEDERGERHPQFMGWAIIDDLIYSIQEVILCI